jgi:4-hydroxy-2-oxoglutarate aldolase
MNTLAIRGILPPMMTPFRENGDLDTEAHVRNMQRWKNDDLGGYLVLGSNSETPYLTEPEKLALVELTAKHAVPGRTILAGTGLESTRETIRLTNLAAGAGAHAALVLTPSFYGSQMGDEAQIRHFRELADASRIPILIYNVPAYTHLVISVAAVRALSAHPNIIGMKDSSGDVPRLAALKAAVPESFHLIVGTAGALYPALTLGVKAGILALANFAGSQCAKVQALYDAGRHDEARALYLKLLPVNTAITATYGVAGMKYAAGLAGYAPGHVRKPLLPLPPQAQEHMQQLLAAAGVLP